MQQISNAHQTTPTYYEPECVAQDPGQHKLRVLIDELATMRGLTIQMSLRLMMLVAAPDADMREGILDEFRTLADQFYLNVELAFGASAMDGQSADQVDWIRRVALETPARRAKMQSVKAAIEALQGRLNSGAPLSYKDAREFYVTNWPIVRDEMTTLIWDLWANLDAEKADAVDDMEKLGETLATTLGDIKKISLTVRMISLNAGVLAVQAGEKGAGFSTVASEIKNLAEQIQSSVGRADSVLIKMNGSSGKG